LSVLATRGVPPDPVRVIHQERGMKQIGVARVLLPCAAAAWPAFNDANPVVMYLGPTVRTGPAPSAGSLEVNERTEEL
jgi:hypothetical protein